ncbi:MAG: Sir2 family NAD-dependent protein deacetylase [Pseudomonadota bacterium]
MRSGSPDGNDQLITDPNAAATFLSDALLACDRAVVFTGAGISTESGIPDFRSPGGIWTKMQPIDFRDFVADEDVRREDWRRRFLMLDQFSDAEPNAGHRAIGDWVRAGRVSAVITQNIDGLHQKGGVPADQVVELHGNGTFATCLDCGIRHEHADIRPGFEQTGTPPACASCGGMVKAAIISFGQEMPRAEMARAEIATLDADLFLAIGSSLVVYPAAGFPILAKRNGARLIIVNRDETELDSLADRLLRGSIGEILGKAADTLG